MPSIRNKPDAATGVFLPAKPNRRWSARQKIHSPAYVSVEPFEDGTIFGLNEVFDIGTDGLAFQNSEQLTAGSRLRLNLELSGIEGPVGASGRVIWSEPSGRTGVQFRKSSLTAPRRLEEYLFLNAITACAHYQALCSTAIEESDPMLESPTAGVGVPAAHEAAAWPDYPAVLSYLAAMSNDFDTTALDLDSVLESVAQRTATFLHAAGVAIALGNGKDMVCLASFGCAPGLGTRLHAGSGFSGQCAQSGELMLCNDAETDSRVDRETCLAMGIRSMVAVPIRVQSKVVGLMEVFSERPYAFNKNSRLFLQRLSQMIVSAHISAARASMMPEGPPGVMYSQANFEGAVLSLNPLAASGSFLEAPEPAFEPEDEFPSSRWTRILVLGAAAVVLLVAALVTPWMRTRAGSAARAHSPQSALRPATRTLNAGSANSQLDEVRQLAEAGDPDAQFAMGARYATGDGVAQSYPIAFHWFSLAAEEGHVVAQATLGAYYWAGRGVPVDLKKAYFWSVLAQAGGDEGSRFRLESLASRLSHREVVVVQEQANEWLRQHQLNARAAADSQP